MNKRRSHFASGSNRFPAPAVAGKQKVHLGWDARDLEWTALSTAARSPAWGAAPLAAMFGAALLCSQAVVDGAPVHLVDQSPVRISHVAPDVVLVDFGRVAFGNLRLEPPMGTSNSLVVHFGEAFADGRVHRRPPGSVRYARVGVALNGHEPIVVAPPPDPRNTQQDTPGTPPAVLTPKEWGVVLPFRWVEIEGWPGELRPEQIRRQAAFATTWNDEAAAFRCSDEMLNRIWDLCHYSTKATTFAGVYVDGDRERIPYEADAYLNQLSHYTTDTDVQMARDTFDWLMRHPTWPTEWPPHMVFMAHADWMHTGDTNWLASRYESLKSKLLVERARADGLITSTPAQIKRGDIVDWPVGERDGFVFTPVNTVVNAFHLRALVLMADLARTVGLPDETAEYSRREQRTRALFQEKLFDEVRGVYRDGEGTDHASLHANLFPLAFELVPSAQRAGVVAFLTQRGMACSVYAAQYLLEGLFKNEAGEAALELITAPGDRSWRHMVESGTTITWEAWDQRYKPNQDWNHAWGAALANLLPRFVLGVQPAAPGWQRVRVRPHPGTLTHARGTVPTPRGPIQVRWERGERFALTLELPPQTSAVLELPAADGSRGIFVEGRSVPSRRQDARWVLDQDVTSTVTVEVR